MFYTKGILNVDVESSYISIKRGTVVMKLLDLLTGAMKCGASDLHLTVGSPPALRVNGKLTKAVVNGCVHPPLTPDDTLNVAKTIMTAEQYQNWLQKGEIDFSHSLPGVGRFRINAYRQRGCACLAIRPVPYQIPSVEELKLPPSVVSLTEKKQGLVLVTGPAGSGKSTTLAALIDKINRERTFTYYHGLKSIETCTTIKVWWTSGNWGSIPFQWRARYMLLCARTDIIVISELRDLETILSGHYGGGNPSGLRRSLLPPAVPTIDRIIDIFPRGQQEQIKVQLSMTLQGVVSQQILPRTDGCGRVLATEILCATPAVRNLIREGKTDQLTTVMQTGSRWGMHTMDMALRDLVHSGDVTAEAALKYVTDQDGFTRSIQ